MRHNTGVSVFRIADGKIQEIHVTMDRLGQMEQLGWMAAANGPPSDSTASARPSPRSAL